MGSFKFRCPHCQQKILADDSYLGTVVHCPACNQDITVQKPENPLESISEKSTRSSVQDLGDATIAGDRYGRPDQQSEATMPGQRDSKPNGRFGVGDLIMGRYKVLAELGQGGMGVVYKCFDETAGIEVALKALPPELSHNTLEMEDIKENFQLVAKLVHQNIAVSKTLERDNSNGNYYLIMECVDGEDLRHWLKRKHKDGDLSIEDVFPIIRQVADALDYAHKEKIIHRDIKPGNIMINAAGDVKVLDFGLAAQIHTSMTRVSMAYQGTSGTGPYMSPEQWKGKPQGAATDQYALAVMTYEMLAGHLPFEAADPSVLREIVLHEKAEAIENISLAINQAIQKAMNQDPAERFESCTAFSNALQDNNFVFHAPKLNPEFQKAITSAGKCGQHLLTWSRTKKNRKKIIWGTAILLLIWGGWSCFPALCRNIPVIGKIDIEYEEAQAKKDAEKLGVRFSEDWHRLIRFPQKAAVTKYKIPACVVIIENNAFENCINLEQVIIPNSVTKIGSNVWKRCEKLSSIEIPNSVLDIGYSCFQECSNLETVSLSDNLSIIPNSMFEDCKKIKYITIPHSIKEIGTHAFRHTGLKEFSMPDSVETIGPGVFDLCKNLKTVKLSKNLTAISPYSFRNCSSLQEIEIPASVVRIGSNSGYRTEGPFCDCISLKKVILHDGLEFIGVCAFNGCSSLKHIKLPQTLRELSKYYVFQNSPCEADALRQFKEIRKKREAL